jgi:(R,R)-butanediol dehydrogenase/meso-butanediol dehydrogenase/diacetyl reductase
VEARVKALRWHAALDLRLDDVAEPRPSAGSVVVEVAHCGICGTDLHEYLHGPVMIRPGPHPLSGHRPPMTLGHELSGVVVAVADDVTEVGIGARVAVDPCLRCGRCRWCRVGEYHICPRGGSLGLASPGGLARRVEVPAVQLNPVPDGVSLEQAALAEPLAVGLHAATRAGIRPGDHVLVLGGGPIGVACLIGARMAGAAAVYVSEPRPGRAGQALGFGATEVFDPTRHDVRREVFRRTGRTGPDVVMEATGRAPLVDLAVRTVRRGGHVVIVGIGLDAVSLDPRQLVLYERRVSGSLGYHHDIPRVLDLMAAGRLDPAGLITDRRPLSAAIGAFEDLRRDDGRHLKIMISPEDD